LVRASLSNSNLAGADLTYADLGQANLEGADLRGARLCAANLQGTVLRGANLCGANLATADSRGADLRGATYNSATLWPGLLFHPGRRGCVRAPAELVPADRAEGRGDEVAGVEEGGGTP
jgi:hypothetical protein